MPPFFIFVDTIKDTRENIRTFIFVCQGNILEIFAIHRGNFSPLLFGFIGMFFCFLCL